MVGWFPTIVETYALRERAEAHAKLLGKYDVQAAVSASRAGVGWDVVVSAAQYPRAAKLTEAAKLTGELRIP